jgi:hypothetical protein
MLHPSGASSLLPFSHHDPLLMNRNNSLFHPVPSHGLAGGPKPPLGFPMPFGPTLHDNQALRHLDSLGLRLMNPAVAAAQFFAAQSSFNPSMGRPTPPGLEPSTAAFLLDPRYRGMAPPSSNSSPSSATSNGTHNHAHIHSHSHTHLHLNNNNDSSSLSNGPPPPPPPPLMPFSNPLSGNIYFVSFRFIYSYLGFPHGNPLLYPGMSMPSPSSLEAMHNLSRERELMAFMLANTSRFDPMALAFANSFQVCVRIF